MLATKVSYIASTLPKTVLAEQGKLGSCSAYLIAVFLLNSLATGQAVMLPAEWQCSCILAFFVRGSLIV